MEIHQAVRLGSRLLLKPIGGISTSKKGGMSLVRPIFDRAARWLSPANIEYELCTTQSGTDYEKVGNCEYSPTTIIIYFHGGGFQFGSPRTHRSITGRLALYSGARVGVYVPDYPLGNREVAVESCDAFVQHILKRRLDKTKLIFAGDSAGGNIALALGLKYAPDGIVALSPWVDLTLYSGATTDPLISSNAINNASRHATDNPYRASITGIPDSSPLHFKPDSTQFFIQYCDDEILAASIEAFAKEANSKGVKVDLSAYAGQVHVFQILAGLLPQANKAMREITDWIKSL